MRGIHLTIDNGLQLPPRFSILCVDQDHALKDSGSRKQLADTLDLSDKRGAVQSIT
jgi:hypothetical protein